MWWTTVSSGSVPNGHEILRGYLSTLPHAESFVASLENIAQVQLRTEYAYNAIDCIRDLILLSNHKVRYSRFQKNETGENDR